MRKLTSTIILNGYDVFQHGKNKIYVNNRKIQRKLITTQYNKPIHSLVLDWSGTTIDPYVCSVSNPMMETFRQFKVSVTNKEVRKPMGNRKDVHIKMIAHDPLVKARWVKVYNREPSEQDVTNLYNDYSKRQIEWLNRPEITTLLPGTKTTIDILREKYGIKIGSTTGFLRSMQNEIIKSTSKQGYNPDVIVAADDVPRSRPFPDGMLTNMLKLQSPNVKAVIKVDDTHSGILEGESIGAWTVGYSRYNNFIGEQFDDCSEVDKLEQTDPSLFRDLLDKSNEHLMEANPDFVIESFNHLPFIVDMLNHEQACR